jgi:hypothetical protein
MGKQQTNEWMDGIGGRTLAGHPKWELGKGIFEKNLIQKKPDGFIA